ncbi:MAG: HAD-IIA family hydrolase [Anaerolineaceae bacterium]
MLTDKYPQVKGLILDMDGVLWHDSNPIGDLPEIFSGIAAMGLKVVLATNNATKSVEEYLTKLRAFGVEVDREQIITSAETTALYLQTHFPAGTTAYVIGTSSLKKTLQSKRLQIATEENCQSADVVVVGLDPNITYDKIRNAGLLVRSGAAFIATNTDATLPTPNGLYPGAGVMVAAIRIASGREPLVIGKPFTAMYEQAFKLLGIRPDQTLGIGDRLETDIISAQNAGCLSALVLSGVTTAEQAASWKPEPDLIAQDLTALLYD